MSGDGNPALLKVTDSDAYKRIINYYPNVRFDEEIAKNEELADFIRTACAHNVNQIDNPRTRPDAPKLDEDFSKYFIINNLPKCNEEKSKKLTELLIKLYAKKNYNLEASRITMPFNDEGMTEGVAFILATSEE